VSHAEVIVYKIAERPTVDSFQILFRVLARVRSGISRNGISQESLTTAIDAFQTYLPGVPSALRETDTAALAVTIKRLLSFPTNSGERDHRSFDISLFNSSRHQILDEILQKQVLGASLLSAAHYECHRDLIGIPFED
jgi:hypothetical protein